MMDAHAPRMRPQFDVHVDTPEHVLAALQQIVDDGPCDFRLQLMRGFGDLRVPEEDEHFFSPTLLIAAEKSDDDTVLRCRFTPRPNVWTGFMALYGVLALVATAGLMYGGSQWLLNRPPWALVGIPVAIALMGFVYGAAFIGQGLGSEQMYRLRHLLDEALHVSRNEPTSGDDTCLPPSAKHS